MKDRILAYLDDFAREKPNELASELKDELRLDDSGFRDRSKEAQNAILHKYAQFSISTIDAFFQKVIRSFTRESGLVGDYRLEVEQDAVLQDVIDNLIDELGDNKELTDWVVEFARENLENEKAWDVRYSLVDFSREIFKEEFKTIEDEVVATTKQKDFFKDLMHVLREKKFSFLNFIKAKANEGVALMHQHGLSRRDFKYSGGPYSFLVKLSKLNSVSDFKDKGVRPEGEFQNSMNWPAKTSNKIPTIRELADEKLIPLLNEILACWNTNFRASLSAEVALSNFYVFGLIADISRKLKEYKDENNMMLLADAPKFLNGIISDSDTPFIYEKVGSFYRNYLIDEFQDTSGLQWRNFLPLITNSIGQGYPNLVVGDVKQAIYRWRGGDLTLLQQEVVKQIGPEMVNVSQLTSNYRSASNVVRFNNAVFKTAANLISLEVGQPMPLEVYEDVTQQASQQEEGFVHVEFLKGSSTQEDWKDQSLSRIPKWIEKLQEEGLALNEIAILVRKHDEGEKIVDYLLQYRQSAEAKKNCRYEVISNESLLLDGASSVNLLLAAMRYLLNTHDAIARAQLSYEYFRMNPADRTMTEVFEVSNQSFFEAALPDAFTREKASLKKLPLFELTETLIRLLGLGKESGEVGYLQAFQDIVLEFSARERNDLGIFLEWWKLNGPNKSIQVSGDIDAVQILTVHKAKGLQFKAVLIPFCSWNLDHERFKAPTLWVKSKTPPFEKAGYLPVKYSSTLEQTYFDSYYVQEKMSTYLDNLNLLYVALTRSEYGLIVLAPHPEVKSYKQTVARILFESIAQGEGLQDGWDKSSQVWSSGEWTNPPERKPTTTHMVTMHEYTSFNWRDKLIVKQSAKEFFGESHADSRNKINYGIHIHAVLSEIKNASEADDALDRLVQEGLVTMQERAELKSLLEDLFNDEQILSWFSPEWIVRTEVPILLAGGGENRLDRLLVRDGQAVVIDFKTGNPVKSDQKQMQEYLYTLSQMNFHSVEGYLLYIRTGEIVPVKSGKPRRIKKKDTQQLDLGL
jgi:ATP-dependent exoDNAse (exonuclease V) beta subunit